jgi:hypothetical protein
MLLCLEIIIIVKLTSNRLANIQNQTKEIIDRTLTEVEYFLL